MAEMGRNQYKIPLKEMLKRTFRRYKRPFLYAFAVMLTFFLIWLAVISLVDKCA